MSESKGLSKEEKRRQKKAERERKKRQRERDKRNQKLNKQTEILAKQDEVSKLKSKQKAERRDKLANTFNILTGGRGVSHKRFRSAFILASCSALLMIGGSTYSFRTMKHNEYLSQITETIFASSLKMSKSKVGVSISKPAMSADGFTTYIPITFNNPKALPSNANDYSVYLVGTNGVMSYEATGQLINYSTSGRSILKISSPTGINNEVVGVMLRSNKDLNLNSINASETTADEKNVATSTSSSKGGMNAFLEKYDSMFFSVNLAGNSIERDDKLNGDANVDYLYAKFYEDSIVDSIKSEIDAKKTSLESLYVQADELISILQRYGYTVPETPTVATRDGLPEIVYPVDLSKTVMDGFVTEEDKSRMTEIVNARLSTQSSSESSDDSSKNTDTDVYHKGLGLLPIALKKDDGTDSNQPVNIRSSIDKNRSASELWQSLVSIWTQIYNEKIDIYQNKALALYEVELEFKDTLSNVTVGKSDNFKQLGKVDPSKKVTPVLKNDKTSGSSSTTDSSSSETVGSSSETISSVDDSGNH